MKTIRFLTLFLFAASLLATHAAEPLRVFVRGGVKTHGPADNRIHDHPRFLGDATRLLGDRGVTVNGGMQFPSADQLAKSDVLVIYAADGMKIEGEQRAYFERFLQRGGGVVVIHDGVVSGPGSDNPDWTKKIIGGAWRWDRPEGQRTKWYEGEVGIYFVNPEHPIVKGMSNFDWKDEIYYDLDMADDVTVLATSFHSVFIIAPQVWTYEQTLAGGTTPYRAFVSLPGHEYDSFEAPHYRALLLRGIAWAGKRANVDEFCDEVELGSLKYPAGGPIAPEKAAEQLHVHPEFDINLVTSEPLVEKIMSVEWGPDGKMWVVETPEYPGGRTINKNDEMVALWSHREPEKVPGGDREDRPAKDRISWLEDTNGDGLMDKKHIFADYQHGVPGGLELVTSLVLHKDGVIVGQAPDILFLRDTNGDGVCDKVEKLYTGFGTFDTHAVINNFRWGLDGWVYCAVGYSAGAPKSAVTGEDFGRITAGILRFKPDGSKLEQVVSGSCNTWGFDFGPDGEMFYTTATCGEHFLHVVMPDNVLARGNVGRVRGSHVAPDHQKIHPLVKHTRPAYVQIDWVGGFTASAGCAIYNGGAWPEKWNGSHLNSETTMSLVHHEFLKPNGISYLAYREPGREDTEFVAGTDLWFRPIHTRIGPDGALYIVDFYNQAAIHNDTRGPKHGARNAATRPDRDHHFTRVWRVQHKQAKPIAKATFEAKNPATLVAALASPNGWTRDTAARLLRENGVGSSFGDLRNLALNTSANGPTRISALYTLAALGSLEGDDLLTAAGDRDPVVRKNALRIAAAQDNRGYLPEPANVRNALNDADLRARLWALIALQTTDHSAETAAAIVAAWPKLNDPHLQSAAIGVTATDPQLFVEAAFKASDPLLADFVNHTLRTMALKGDAGAAARMVTLLARQPASADGLKQVAVEALAANLRPEVVPAWNSELATALKSLLASPRPGLPGAVLPLVARWDKQAALAGDLKPVITQLNTRLGDASMPDAQRAQVAINLLGVRQLDAAIVPAVAQLLGGTGGADLQRRVIDALAATGDATVGTELVAAYNRVPAELRENVFGSLVRRADWAQALLTALADRKIDLLTLGPANQHRLRNHSDLAVARKANEVIDALKGPEQKEKDALVAQFLPEVMKAGNPAKGRELFIMNCAPCHKFKDVGADFGPNITGMGAHGPGELLIQIIDPNRLVEPNYVAVSIETKDDNVYDGIVLRENNAAVILRNQTAEYELAKDTITRRTSTGRSLMPEGFEALGAEGLRDLIAFIAEDERRFRILDLTPVFNGNSNEGIYASKESRGETVRLRTFGALKVGEIPFDIISPQKSVSGQNLLTLKGRLGMAPQYPQKVEVKVNFTANRLHVLGGVGGWAYPWEADRHQDKPVVKATVRYAGGDSEELVFKNGVEFADYIGSGDNFNVPGSESVPNLVRSGQVRYFSKDLKKSGLITAIELESFNNEIAPTFVALTVEQAEGPARRTAQLTTPAAAAPAAPQRVHEWGSGVKALLIGGGASHDYEKWFNEYDTKVLNASGRYTARYYEPQELTVAIVKSADVLIISANKAFPDQAVRAAIFAHVETGKGLVLLHPGVWYNWNDWPEFNRQLAGGGSRGHDRLGDFEVKIIRPNHEIVQGVPATFTILDELYWFEADAQGTPTESLADAHSQQKMRAYQQVFVVKHPKARIAAITLGHDGRAHEHPAFQKLMLNALDWVRSGKP